jgi:hypothetical protein
MSYEIRVNTAEEAAPAMYAKLAAIRQEQGNPNLQLVNPVLEPVFEKDLRDEDGRQIPNNIVGHIVKFSVA